MSNEYPPPVLQNLKKYNRESGRKTLILVGILIVAIAILSIFSLILITKPHVLTSSIDNRQTAPKATTK